MIIKRIKLKKFYFFSLFKERHDNLNLNKAHLISDEKLRKYLVLIFVLLNCDFLL